MARLYILRHVKSSPALPGESDFERRPSERGENDLLKIAKRMEERSYLPEQIYSSPATRTRMTTEGINNAIQLVDFPVKYMDNLYSGSVNEYLAVLQSPSNKLHSLMIVGHNPACANLAISLIRNGDARDMKAISIKFPAGALAVIDMEVDQWADIGARTGYLRDFILPKEL